MKQQEFHLSLMVKLILDLKENIDQLNIEMADDYGIESKMKESLLMAVLAVARMQNLPTNMPSASGANRQTVLGEILRFEQDQ